jgi:hypothetical protein
MNMQVGQESILGALSLDTMVHPDFRNQGIFVTLAKITFSEASKDGIKCVYGFPNQSSYPGFINKLDWIDVSKMRVAIRPLDIANLIMGKAGNKFGLKIAGTTCNYLYNRVLFRNWQESGKRDSSIKQITLFDDRFDKFWIQVADQFFITLMRNKNYLNWRYVNVPDKNYLIFISDGGNKINGYIVFRAVDLKERDCAIFDILAESETVAQSLIRECLQYCRLKKMNRISWASLTNTQFHKAFRMSGFISTPLFKGSKFCTFTNSIQLSREFISKPDNWCIHLGASDML